MPFRTTTTTWSYRSYCLYSCGKQFVYLYVQAQVPHGEEKHHTLRCLSKSSAFKEVIPLIFNAYLIHNIPYSLADYSPSQTNHLFDGAADAMQMILTCPATAQCASASVKVRKARTSQTHRDDT